MSERQTKEKPQDRILQLVDQALAVLRKKDDEPSTS